MNFDTLNLGQLLRLLEDRLDNRIINRSPLQNFVGVASQFNRVKTTFQIIQPILEKLAQGGGSNQQEINAILAEINSIEGDITTLQNEVNTLENANPGNVFYVGPNERFTTISDALTEAYTKVEAEETITIYLVGGVNYTWTGTVSNRNPIEIAVGTPTFFSSPNNIGQNSIALDINLQQSTDYTPKLRFDNVRVTGDLTILGGWGVAFYNSVVFLDNIDIDLTTATLSSALEIVGGSYGLNERLLVTNPAGSASLRASIAIRDCNVAFLSFPESAVQLDQFSALNIYNSRIAIISLILANPIFTTSDSDNSFVEIGESSLIVFRGGVSCVLFGPIGTTEPLTVTWYNAVFAEVTGTGTFTFGARTDTHAPMILGSNTLPDSVAPNDPPVGTIFQDVPGALGFTQYSFAFWNGTTWVQ